MSRFPEDEPSETERKEVNTINTKIKSKKNKIKESEKGNKVNYRSLSLENVKRNQEKDGMCLALINYFVNDDILPHEYKILRKEIDNFYYDFDKGILCRIVTDEANRNQTSIIPVLPEKLIMPAFEYFYSDIGGHLGVTKTFHKLKQYFYVPTALTKLKEYVSACEKCNLRKNPQAYPNPLWDEFR